MTSEMTAKVQAACDAFGEVRDFSKVVSPKEAFDFVDAYKASTGHRPSLCAMVLLYLREKAKNEAAGN